MNHARRLRLSVQPAVTVREFHSNSLRLPSQRKRVFTVPSSLSIFSIQRCRLCRDSDRDTVAPGPNSEAASEQPATISGRAAEAGRTETRQGRQFKIGCRGTNQTSEEQTTFTLLKLDSVGNNDAPGPAVRRKKKQYMNINCKSFGFKTPYLVTYKNAGGFPLRFITVI